MSNLPKRNLRAIAYVGGALLMILLIWNLFSPRYTPVSSQNTASLLISGVIAGAVIMFLIWRLMAKNTTAIRESSHTVVESVRKVFKVVTAEGQFNELYNFEETKKIFGIIPSTKRALVIIEAKVLVGFDFEKCVWEADEKSQSIRLIEFPAPEILSIEPDYKYYDFDEGIFNLLNRKDLTSIQVNGKRQVEAAAMQSSLPAIAAEQMRTILTEVVESKKWKLEDGHKIRAIRDAKSKNGER